MSPRRRRDTDQEGMDDGAGHQLTVGSKPPPAYSLNTPMTELGDRLIAGQEDLAQLREFGIAFMRRDSTRTDNEFHVDKASKVRKRSEIEVVLRGDVHAVIWLQGKDWDGFTPQQRMAWMHSLLLRIHVTEKGALKILKPDVVEWPSIIGRYGAWNQPLQLALELNDRRDGPLLGEPGPRRLTSVPANEGGPPPVTH